MCPLYPSPRRIIATLNFSSCYENELQRVYTVKLGGPDISDWFIAGLEHAHHSDKMARMDFMAYEENEFAGFKTKHGTFFNIFHPRSVTYEGVSKSFRTESITK
jgi:hypothetical protein